MDKKRLFFLILWCLTTCMVIVLSMFSRKEDACSCNGEARVLYRHQNVTRSELHDLVSLFFDSDQVTSFECRKEYSPEMRENYVIRCSLNIQDEPVTFAQETVSHIVSVNMMSGKEESANLLRASPLSNHLGVRLTFAVYKTNLPPDAREEQHVEATIGFKHKLPIHWSAIISLALILIITFLVRYVFHTIRRIAMVEEDFRQIMKLKARAEAADVAKSQFLAVVSHEIRTPMSGVLGMLKFLMDTDLDAKQMDYAQTAHGSGKDLISLLNDILDVAKIESGKVELEKVPFDMRLVLDNVSCLLSGKANEKGIELAVYVSTQVPDMVVGDPGRFRQIITNLVGNSIKFTQGKGHIFISVHLADEVRDPFNVEDAVLKQRLAEGCSVSGETVSGFPAVNARGSWKSFKTFCSADNHDSVRTKLLVTVEDTGVGIPLDAQGQIFAPFMQGNSSTSRTYGGTGIGLSISKDLVGFMHGEIGFVSKPGIGSTFSFTGVFGKAETNSSITKFQRFDLAIDEFKGFRALVIDSRHIRAKVTSYHLQRLGISADIVSSLRAACSCVSKLGNLAMVLIDKDAWIKKDLEVLEKLLISNKETSKISPKILLLATSATLVERREMKSSGLVDEVVIKPLRMSVLICCLQETLVNGKKKLPNRKRTNLGHSLRGKRILVVEDNLLNRKVTEGALKKYGAIVTCVDSGKSAVAMLKPPHIFDACFMDLQMPEMDGIEATRRVRDLERDINKKIVSAEMCNKFSTWHVPILAMTAGLFQGTSEKCLKIGFDGYVSKPFEEDALYEAAAKILESG